jgi:hypothetical protein
MSGGEIAEVIAILAVFLGGVTLGVLVIVCKAIKREDRQFSLRRAAPGTFERGTRVLTGVGSRNSSSPGSSSGNSSSPGSSSRYSSEQSP